MFPIVVENNLGEKELMALNKIVLNKNRWLMPVMIAIIAVCGLLIYLVERQITAELIWCACVVVLCTLWVYVFAPLITKHSVKKQQAPKLSNKCRQRRKKAHSPRRCRRRKKR